MSGTIARLLCCASSCTILLGCTQRLLVDSDPPQARVWVRIPYKERLWLWQLYGNTPTQIPGGRKQHIAVRKDGYSTFNGVVDHDCLIQLRQVVSEEQKAIPLTVYSVPTKTRVHLRDHHYVLDKNFEVWTRDEVTPWTFDLTVHKHSYDDGSVSYFVRAVDGIKNVGGWMSPDPHFRMALQCRSFDFESFGIAHHSLCFIHIKPIDWSELWNQGVRIIVWDMDLEWPRWEKENVKCVAKVLDVSSGRIDKSFTCTVGVRRSLDSVSRLVAGHIGAVFATGLQPRIAVLPFDEQGQLPIANMGHAVGSLVESHIAEFQKCEVITRSEVDTILQEHDLAAADIIDNPGLLRGKVSGVDYIVVGSIIGPEAATP